MMVDSIRPNPFSKSIWEDLVALLKQMNHTRDMVVNINA